MKKNLKNNGILVWDIFGKSYLTGEWGLVDQRYCEGLKDILFKLKNFHENTLEECYTEVVKEDRFPFCFCHVINSGDHSIKGSYYLVPRIIKRRTH